MRNLLIFAATLALVPVTFLAAPAAACPACDGAANSEGGGGGGGGGGRLNAMLEAADVDESGGLSLEEFVASRNSMREQIADGVTCQHEGGEECGCAGRGGDDRPADTDGDGQVSDEERTAHMAVRFAQIDTDGDGSLTIDELRTARRARRGFGSNNTETETE